MELRFKPKFLRDLRTIHSLEVQLSVAKIILKIESSKSLSAIPNLIKLDKYKTLYRIRIKFSEKLNYRMVISVRGNVVWAERVLHRDAIYGYFGR